MSFNVNLWMNQLTAQLQEVFGPRLQAVGLQGSFARGEETSASDIDAVVILDTLSPQDIALYKEILSRMPSTGSHPVCGFFGGKTDLQNWAKGELFQFILDTHMIYGSLANILPAPTRADALLAVQSGAGTIYHALVHTWIHGQLTPGFITSLCKAAFFMLQAAHFAQTGRYLPSKAQLLKETESAEERAILSVLGKELSASETQQTAALLLSCCQRLLAYAKSPTLK